VLGFFIHLIVHVVQFGVYRSYIPAIVTSVPAGLYCLAALYSLSVRVKLNLPEVAAWTLAAVVVIAVNLILAHGLAARFQRYLDERCV
jgi:hypothetical protein